MTVIDGACLLRQGADLAEAGGEPPACLPPQKQVQDRLNLRQQSPAIGGNSRENAVSGFQSQVRLDLFRRTALADHGRKCGG